MRRRSGPRRSTWAAIEPTADEFFVTILRGRGLGQTRRVTARQGETYLLDRPWRVTPETGALVLVHTGFYRNHIIDNRTVDGYTGVLLWISCIENIMSGNEIRRTRGQGLFLYGTCTTLASSMPCSWNSGIGPLFFNHIEGSQCDETSCGALVTSGETPDLPVEFPVALGNVLRHNSLVRSRTDGLAVNSNRPVDPHRPSPAVLGTIAEFNVVRDAVTGYHVAPSAEATLLRRNHAYFWYPVNLQPGPRVAVMVDSEKTTVVTEQNIVEGIHGVEDRAYDPRTAWAQPTQAATITRQPEKSRPPCHTLGFPPLGEQANCGPAINARAMVVIH